MIKFGLSMVVIIKIKDVKNEFEALGNDDYENNKESLQ